MMQTVAHGAQQPSKKSLENEVNVARGSGHLWLVMEGERFALSTPIRGDMTRQLAAGRGDPAQEDGLFTSGVAASSIARLSELGGGQASLLSDDGERSWAVRVEKVIPSFSVVVARLVSQ